ncbi:hypothetical protein GUJ93_ZPchr0012g21538 [Zizania palustris]|uniref:Clathrin/coatomer adaptor adaptin-like N-terminal domain-containing protein n=1 Tax=Zizania palustris TaxID=103762 RepID=A0A8J5WMQ9_ZIZPA|nr:hypothetical protein GUJ93_ZPchr0012g21538 [Zizania palustris]
MDSFKVSWFSARPALLQLSPSIASLLRVATKSSPGLYKKRKNAVLEGGLIGLATFTIRLTTEDAHHLEQIVPPMLSSFLDQDSRVRYYVCEGLYKIAKVVRGDFIIYINKKFGALCKLSADSDVNVQSAAHLLDKLVKVHQILELSVFKN